MCIQLLYDTSFVIATKSDIMNAYHVVVAGTDRSSFFVGVQSYNKMLGTIAQDKRYINIGDFIVPLKLLSI